MNGRQAMQASTLILLMVSAAGRATALPRQTYQALVFNGPVEGREAEYNRWYDTQHAPDVVSIQGFVTAQRYRRADIQLRPEAGTCPPYLVAYEILTDNLAKVYDDVHQRAQDGRTRMSDSMARGGGMNITYRVTSTTSWPGTADPKVSYLQVVLANARPGEEPAQDRWYRNHHAPDILAVPGFAGDLLGEAAADQMIPDARPARHLAMFRIETADLAKTIADFRAKADKMTPGPALVDLWGCTYQSIGPRLSGDAIRRQRAEAAH
jgi:hypothetical protein